MISDPAMYLPDTFSSGDTLRGYLTYDLVNQDMDPDPHRGFYQYSMLPTTLVVYGDGGWVFRPQEPGRDMQLTIGDSLVYGGEPVDLFKLKSVTNTAYSDQAGWGLPMGWIQFELIDKSLEALSDDGLPETPIDITDWSHRQEVLITGDGLLFVIWARLVAIGQELPTSARRLEPQLPRLDPNVPNPFCPITTLPFSIGRAARVKMEVYNVAGQRVRLLVDESMPAGLHTVRWDGRDDRGRAVVSGTYFYRLVVDGKSLARTATLIR